MILVNGCSFTECYTLPDSEASWPAILGKGLDQKVINLASGGGSNDRIARTTQEWLYTRDRPDLVVIGWTSYTRSELPTYNGQHIKCTPNGSLIEDSSLHHNPDVDQIHDWYYKYCHNEHLALKRTLLHMVTLGELLTHMQIPYVFFNSIDDNHFPGILNGDIDDIAKSAFEYYAHEPLQFPDSISTTQQNLLQLVHKLDQQKWLWWPNGTYRDRFWFCPKDPTGHFLDEGNRLMAKSLLEFL